MSQIICKAYFSMEYSTDIALATTISPSFRAALTPWILTLSAEKKRQVWFVDGFACFSLSPTFQFTRSLWVHLRSHADQQVMNSDLCVPLFSHLKTLKLSYSHRRHRIRFDHGNEVADFILKFQRLQKFELRLHPESTPPSEFINFYIRLFHSRSISQTLLVSAVDSYASNSYKCVSSHKRSEYCDLIKKHKIIPYLVQKMVEVYRNDHGESLSVFLEAIQNSFLRSGPRTESDSIDELVPVFDLLEAIVINGDLLHSCFQTQSEEGIIDLSERKWTLATIVSGMLSHCICSANYSRFEFMQRYGRTLLPQLLDFVFSQYDGSLPAAACLVFGLETLFHVQDDHFWTDEVESKTDEEGLKKMLESGRKLLQHIPFDKLEFVITKAIAIDHCPSHDLMQYFALFVSGLISYCDRVASLSSELKEAVVRDIAPKIIEHNILPLCFDFLVSSFLDYGMDRDVGRRNSQTWFLGDICMFLVPINYRTRAYPPYRHLPPVVSVLGKDFFSRDGIIQKLLNFGDTVCDELEEVFNMLRCIIQKKVLRKENLSALDLKYIKSYDELAVQLLNDFSRNLMALIKSAKSVLLEEVEAAKSAKKVIDDSMIENCAQLENAAARHDGLKNQFITFRQENCDNIPLDPFAMLF